MGDSRPSDEISLLGGLTIGLFALVLLLFTPYTHQLDEIKRAVLLMGVPGLLLLSATSVDPRTLGRGSKVALALLAGYAGALVISMLAGSTPSKVAERELWVRLAGPSLAFCLALSLSSRRRLRNAAWALSGLAGLLSATGLWMYAGGLLLTRDLLQTSSLPGLAPWTTLLYALGKNPVMSSTLLGREYFALFLLMVFCFPPALFFTERRRARRAAALGIGLLMAACLALTWEWVPDLMRQMPGFPLLWSGALAVWRFGPGSEANGLDWESLLFGTGPGGFRTWFPVHRRADYLDYSINQVTSSSSSLYLDLLAETGVVGLTMFTGLAAWVLLATIQLIRRKRNRRFVCYGLASLAGLGTALLAATMTYAFSALTVAVTFWMVLGFSIGVIRVGERQTATDASAAHLSQSAVRRDTGRRIAVQLGLAAAALLFAWRAVPQAVNGFRAQLEYAQGLRNLDFAGAMSGNRKMYLRRSLIYLQRAADLDPAVPGILYLLADVHARLGNDEASVETYRRVQELAPHYKEVNLRLKETRAGQ